MDSLEYKGYRGQYVYDAEAGIYHGDVVLLSDVVTFQGRSIEELKQALAESIEVYLEFCAEKGKVPEKPHSSTSPPCKAAQTPNPWSQ